MSTAKLNKQQRMAIEHPCKEAMECSKQMYRGVFGLPGMTVSQLVTVNIGEE